MCKSRRESNIDRKEEIEKLYSNLDDLQASSSEVANSVVNVAKDIIFEFNEKAKDHSRNWLFDLDRESDEKYQKFRKQLKSFFGEDADRYQQPSVDFFPKFYEIRDSIGRDFGETNSPISSFLRDGYAHSFPELFRGSCRNGVTPFGYYSFKTPSTRYYNDCLNKKGESVWDSQGYWRCLFPNSEVPLDLLKYRSEKLPHEILTKEDLQSEIKARGIDETSLTIDLGEKGQFFRKFDDYLNWKNIMYENVKREKELKLKNFIEENKNKAADEKQVISSSLQSNYSTNPDTNSVELHEVKTEVFNDGTSLTTTITKSKPYGSDKWEKENETVEKGDSSNLKGWFWK